MNATPRMRFGGYPETPAPGHRGQTPSPTRNARPRASLPEAPVNTAAATPESQPLIPLAVIDGPSQRRYACAIYIGLLAWHFYDWFKADNNGGSAYFFTKWVFLDFLYLFSLPSLRIPRMEYSSSAVMYYYVAHVIFNWLSMFNIIPMPGISWLLFFWRIFYNREIAISEHNVKVSNILHNSSLIMGKQIINILPEGSALLNPDRHPYCLGGEGHSIASVPLYFNATVPVEVELIRFHLETNAEEIVKLGRREIKEIGRQSATSLEDGTLGSYKYDLLIKKPGAYRLNKVLDEYKLEVQRISAPTFVVPCPKAKVRTAESSTRCLGDLSDLSLDVDGTPPLKIVYSRSINGKDHSFHFQSLQPEGFSSPLLGSQPSTSLISPGNEDYTWARSQKVVVSLNESMTNAGEWQYSVDEVLDVFGNKVSFSQPEEAEMRSRPKNLFQNFIVRERPRATIVGCDLRHPLKVAKGRRTTLPVRIGRPGQTPESVPHTLTWHFSPIDTLSESGDHGDVVEAGSFTAKNVDDQPTISAPGLYTLKSVSCASCDGEIDEPSSCLLLNPPEPKLTIQAEEIADKCAGNPIGLAVNLDLVGTPPFLVQYDVISETERFIRSENIEVKGLREHFDLRPRNAGRYQYRFRKLQDAIYSVALPPTDDYFLEQNVKPPADAFFLDVSGTVNACLDQPVKLDVVLDGDGPFNLEWELVHDGKRKAAKETELSTRTFKIETAPLSSGGDYTLALKSIQDRTGCRISLKEEVKISVRRQKPRAAFGLLENKRSTTVVEAAPVNLPLRLSGDGPWRVFYRNLNGSAETETRVARSGNDFIEAKAQGTYEIVDVMDSLCPGTIDPKAKTFDVGYFPRPQLSLVPTDAIQPTDRDHKYIKKDVCEGDTDGFEVALQGSPPYHVQYEIKYKPKKGSGYVHQEEFDAALGKSSIPMDTSKAGLYSYAFSALSDNLYNNDKKKQSSLLTLEQTVNAKPSASFVKPGQTFKSCMSEQAEERIPIKLEGKAPFYLELEIKHYTGNFPEVFRIPNIQTNTYDIVIPRQYLKLGGQQVRIRKVRDDRGCRVEAETGGPVVHFQLYDAPAIYPLEQRTDFCVGERLAYTLSGTPPFEVHYEFAGKQMKAKSPTTNFRRVAESPGDFAITGISDKASDCRAAVNLSSTIHPMPSVKISKGRILQVDIHEGSEVEILFEFWGTAPFEFTYTRSTNARKGQKTQVLETRHDISYEHSKTVTASLEGTYEVVAIKDKFCSFSTMNVVAQENNQKVLRY
ncbi:Uu.00g136010.m01.CDS01 [Anthostomella pinea]|uniref:Uu.00g136010.m01.CDS01 n=1 Tax=Anthostomella pinea TaxID=933095 RepID=A0AAI8VP77_9PEZI|nr:Uu.00g136010.m01.CDS01 [Anthostomella pinea]